jgi:hypothetical protein
LNARLGPRDRCEIELYIDAGRLVISTGWPIKPEADHIGGSLCAKAAQTNRDSARRNLDGREGALDPEAAPRVVAATSNVPIPGGVVKISAPLLVRLTIERARRCRRHSE